VGVVEGRNEKDSDLAQRGWNVDVQSDVEQVI